MSGLSMIIPLLLSIQLLIQYGSILNNDDPTHHNCHMWGMLLKGEADETVSRMIEEHLYSGKIETLKNLGTERNRDGWGIGFFKDVMGDEPVVMRSPLSAGEDPNFDSAVIELAYPPPSHAIAHVRAASSGCIPESGNPHPFKRNFDGRWFLFAHNGTINRNLLLDLLGEEYLEENPILTCPEDPVDTELYMLYIFKKATEWCGDIERGIFEAILDIADRIEGDSEYLNFIMTDGERLWALHFKNPSSVGYRLFTYTSNNAYFISTSALNGNYDSWIEIPDYTLYMFHPDSMPLISDFRRYLSFSLDTDGDGDYCDRDVRIVSSNRLKYRVGFMNMNGEEIEDGVIEVMMGRGAIVTDSTPTPDEVIDYTNDAEERVGDGKFGSVMRWFLKQDKIKRIDIHATAYCPEAGEIEAIVNVKGSNIEEISEKIENICLPYEGEGRTPFSGGNGGGCSSCRSARIGGGLSTFMLIFLMIPVVYRSCKQP